MAYDTNVGSLPDVLATVRRGRLHDPLERIGPSGRTILKGGTLIDPANGVEAEKDVALRGQRVEEVEDEIRPEPGDRVFDVRGLQVWPGLIDHHLHLGDLFETSSAPIFESVADGVTVALSPAASNSLRPAFLRVPVPATITGSLLVWENGDRECSKELILWAGLEQI